MKPLVLALLLVSPIVNVEAHTRRVPIVGLPCEGCEAIFDGIPVTIPSSVRLAPREEPGTPLVIEGQVTDASGRARPDIVIYTYQTNLAGVYPESPLIRDRETRRHGTLRGWVKTDAEGRYRIETIRPGSYPASDLPAHIHFHVLEPRCATYYIDDIMFLDDPKLTEKQLKRLTADRGGSGLVAPAIKAGGSYVKRDIRLGANIPGYKPCS